MNDMIYFLAIRSQQGEVLMTQRLTICHWYKGQYQEVGEHIPLGGQWVLPFIISGAAGTRVEELLSQWEQQSGVALGALSCTQRPLGRSSTLLEIVVPVLGDLVKLIGARVAASLDGHGPVHHGLGLWTFDRVEARPLSDLMRLANGVVVPPLPVERYQHYLNIHFEHLMVCSLLAGRPAGDTGAIHQTVTPLLPDREPQVQSSDVPRLLHDGAGHVIPLREEDE